MALVPNIRFVLVIVSRDYPFAALLCLLLFCASLAFCCSPWLSSRPFIFGPRVVSPNCVLASRVPAGVTYFWSARCVTELRFKFLVQIGASVSLACASLLGRVTELRFQIRIGASVSLGCASLLACVTELRFRVLFGFRGFVQPNCV